MQYIPVEVLIPYIEAKHKPLGIRPPLGPLSSQDGMALGGFADGLGQRPRRGMPKIILVRIFHSLRCIHTNSFVSPGVEFSVGIFASVLRLLVAVREVCMDSSVTCVGGLEVV